MNSNANDDSLVLTGGNLVRSDLLDLLAFNFSEARIWLGDRRMMMVDVTFFGALRQRLIKTIGIDETKKLLMQLGFQSGLKDSTLLRQRWPDAPTNRQRFSVVSPHTLQGIAKLAIVRAEYDPDGSITRGEFEWKHTVEADAHLSAFGRSNVPVCWMQQGYATGYAFGMHGHLNVYEEIGCRAMGNATCTVVGGRLAKYENAHAFLEFYDFLDPYVKKDDLPKRVKKKSKKQSKTVVDVSSGESDDELSDSIVGKSPALAITKQMLKSVAPSSATVLFSGESGVGKELFTRNLHRLSSRADKPFIAVSCAAIPETLIEAELFGVERGAYTGASASRPGRFERANGGTLFLDEIGSLNQTSQVKLLRVIQEREVERIGGTTSISLDVRLVAANNVPLRDLVDRGEFREDLFYRLNVFPIHVPPLRERREDIPDLMAHYLKRYNLQYERKIAGFTSKATRALLNYPYPGNIRELQNLIERAVILAEGDKIDVTNLFAYGESLESDLWGIDSTGRINPRAARRSGVEPIDQMMRFAEGSDEFSWPNLEERLFASVARRVLSSVDGNISAAARRLGLKRHQLEYRLKQLDLVTTAK